MAGNLWTLFSKNVIIIYIIFEKEICRMSGNPKEIIGNKYGRLTVLKKTDKKNSNGCYI